MTALASPTSTSNQENVKILFNNEPAGKTTVNLAVKNVQKTTAGTASFSNSNTGDLDALASAALQASTGK